jgi:hypothetical protein
MGCSRRNRRRCSPPGILVLVCPSLFPCSLPLADNIGRCYNTRRRRQRGQSPMYGTGWMPGHKPAGNQPGYYNNGAAAPPYSPPVDNQYTGNTFNSNEGYYGNAYNNGYGAQQGGIELQQPQHSYQPRGGDPVYEAPQGPPPGKGDGIIR